MIPLRWRYLGILAVLQVLDILTTGGAWAAPQSREANPATQLLMHAFGPLWWWPKLAVIAVLALTVPRAPTRSYYKACAGVTVVYALVIVWNVVNTTL